MFTSRNNHIPNFTCYRGWKCLYTILTNHCSEAERRQVKLFEKEHLKRIRILNDIKFVKRCYQSRLIPNGLKLRNPIKHSERFIFTTDNKLLCMLCPLLYYP